MEGENRLLQGPDFFLVFHFLPLGSKAVTKIYATWNHDDDNDDDYYYYVYAVTCRLKHFDNGILPSELLCFLTCPTSHFHNLIQVSETPFALIFKRKIEEALL